MPMAKKWIPPVVVMALLIAAFFLIPNGSPGVPVPDYDQEEADGIVEYRGVTYQPKGNLETVLFIGLDRELDGKPVSYNNQAQADFLALLILDHREESYTLLHLNRDSMCQIPMLDINGIRIGTHEAQLAVSHTYGSGGKDSCINTAKAVSALLYDCPVDWYLSIPVQSVPLLNDAIGGVEVLIEDDFSGVDSTLVQGQRVRLMGAQAEHFVRARGQMSDSSNVARMKRQQTYLYGLLEALADRQADTAWVENLTSQLNEEMVTDLSVDRMTRIVNWVRQYQFQGLRIVEGTAQPGEKYMEYTVDEAQLRELVLELFYSPMENANENG